VHVATVSVTCQKACYLTVGVVEHHVLAETARGADPPLPPGEHRLPPVALCTEVPYLFISRVLEPHGLSAVVQYHRTVLPGSLGHSGEDVPRSRVARRRGHLYRGRGQVRTGTEAPGIRPGRGGSRPPRLLGAPAGPTARHTQQHGPGGAGELKEPLAGKSGVQVVPLPEHPSARHRLRLRRPEVSGGYSADLRLPAQLGRPGFRRLPPTRRHHSSRCRGWRSATSIIENAPYGSNQEPALERSATEAARKAPGAAYRRGSALKMA
jgi:hypothetical protein